MAIRRRYIAGLVERLLGRFEMVSAPIDLNRLTANLGVMVRPTPAPEELCGFLYRDEEGKTAVIGVNSSHSPSRQRFTIAHELGHFLLHTAEPIHVDRSAYGFSIMRRDEESSRGTTPDEVEANTFAAELLMPRGLLERDLVTIQTTDLMDESVLKEMAGRYQVSVQALTFRLANLGYIRI